MQGLIVKVVDMQLKNLFSTLLMTVILIQASIVSAAESKPIRLATLPIIIANGVEISNDTVSEMQVKIARALHVPLNDTLKKIDYIPSSTSTVALQEIWSKSYSKNKLSTLSETMKPLAKKINADVIVCTVIYRCNQMTSFSSGSFGESHIISNAAVELIYFDNRTGELISKKFPQSYRGEYMRYGTSDFLALDATIASNTDFGTSS